MHHNIVQKYGSVRERRPEKAQKWHLPLPKKYTKHLYHTVTSLQVERNEHSTPLPQSIINHQSISLIATLRPESRIANDMQLK